MDKSKYYEFTGNLRVEFEPNRYSFKGDPLVEYQTEMIEELRKERPNATIHKLRDIAKNSCPKKLNMAGTPLGRWYNRLPKIGKTLRPICRVRKMHWKIDELTVRGYIEFDKPIGIDKLMDMNQPDFTYVKCEKKNEVPDDFLHQDSIFYD